MNKKYLSLLAFVIAGALVVGWGFKRIENAQHVQNTVISLKETQKAACHSANVVRAQTNVNGYAEYRAWVTFVAVSEPPVSEAAKKALQPVLDQTWIPLTDCTIPPPHAKEGYPIPSAVKFAVKPPPPSALVVPAIDP